MIARPVGRRLRHAALAAAVGLTLSGLAYADAFASIPKPGGAAIAMADEAGTALHWGSCPIRRYPELQGSGARCTRLRVPLSYAKPSGTQITLEVSRVAHTAATDKGVILANPGGPGDGGLALPADLAPAVPNHVGADYDWIGWDPRGVGASTPNVVCDRGYFDGPRRSYVPSTPSLLKYWQHRSRKYAQSCAAHHPQLLRHMTSLDTVKDMDSIRRALGVQRISYYGFSYGTYLGGLYSTLYPQHLDRMVLDSNIDPRSVWYAANLDQDKAFNRNIEIYFGWVASHDAVWHLGTTQKAVSARYYRELNALTKHPDGSLGGDEFSDSFEQAAYYQSNWDSLTAAWRSFAHGSAGAMRQEWQSADHAPGSNNQFAAYNAVQCTDTQWPTKWATWQSDNDRINAGYPFLTWNNAWFNAPCLYWPAPAHEPVTISGAKTPSALLIDETLDAATPYEGSLEVRRLYPNARLIAEPGGTTHADSLNGDKCVDDKIAAYLAAGALPARRPGNVADVTCAPLPRPNPRADGN